MKGILLRRIGALAVTAALCAGAYQAARLAWADHLAASGTAAGVERATRLTPGNAEYWLRLANIREAAGEVPGDAVERALAANAQNAELWVRVGLRAEMDGDLARAERCLLRAAHVSRLYEPAWTLANYYFRRDNAAEFWRWVRRAAERSYGDRRALFHLAWEMAADGETVARAIPPGGVVACQYLDYLLERNRLDAAQAAAGRLCEHAVAEDRDALLRYVNRMLEVGRRDAALAAWNALCGRGLMPYEALDAAQGKMLTNGHFTRAPLDAGFDWRMPQPAGVSTAWSEKPPYLRISFSGKQPERCEVLAQVAPVVAGRSYRLRFDYQTRGIQAETGLRWKIYGAAAEGDLPVRAPQLSSEEWKTESAWFTAPAGTGWIRLALIYERMPGTTRIEGAVTLRAIALEEAR